MTEMALFVNACSAVVFIAGFAKNWMLADGNLKPVYWLNILMGVAGIGMNLALVFVMPEMWGLLSFLVLHVWATIMGIKGLLRLRRLRQFDKIVSQVE